MDRFGWLAILLFPAVRARHSISLLLSVTRSRKHHHHSRLRRDRPPLLREPPHPGCCHLERSCCAKGKRRRLSVRGFACSIMLHAHTHRRWHERRPRPARRLSATVVLSRRTAEREVWSLCRLVRWMLWGCSRVLEITYASYVGDSVLLECFLLCAPLQA